jgi:hypothetical protein
MRGLVLGLASAAFVASLGAAPADAAAWKRAGAQPFGGARPFASKAVDSGRRIDINQINMFVTNTGSFAFDFENSDAGLFWPKGTTRSAVFASGLWMGAKVGSEVRVALAEYSQEYVPGAMVGTLPDDPNKSEYRVFKVARFTGARNEQGLLADTLHLEGEGDPSIFQDELVHHSWSEYMAGAAPHGAPWRFYRLPDTATPAPDDSVDVPGPDVIGDQMLWCVYNDADPDGHNNDAGSTAPLGVEVQQTTFAFDRQSSLGQTLFIKYRLINKGGNTLDSMFISQWSDPDLGGAAGFTDDLVGCDTLPDGTAQPRSMGYVYNSQENDGGYGSPPPALGYDFFQGPLVGGNRLPLASFNKYINGTDPQNFLQTFNYMKGFYPDGSPVIDPSGNETRYMVAGDPVSPITGSWLDTAPADRRFLMSAGPFTMAPGDTQEVVVGIIIAQGADRLSSISALRFNDEFAQDAFNKGFDLPSPPTQPSVVTSVDHGQVTLSWDTASRTDYNEPGYAFQGYVVYQGESRSGPWRRLNVYDEIDNIRVIKDAVFDLETGQLIQDYPVAFGSDAGVRYTHTVTQDAWRGTSLYDGTEYYFAVTSYSYNPAGVPKVLENSQAVIVTMPQRPASGTDLETASATDVEHVLRDPIRAPATDVVTVEVMNPQLVTGHTYKVEFTPLTPPFHGTIGTDTATVKHAWQLVDSTDANRVVFSGQLNRRGDEDYLVAEGLRVKVSGKYFPQFQEAAYRNIDATNRRALAGVNFGLESFEGGAGFGFTFFGGTLDPATVSTDSFTTVQYRFNATQKAYRFLRLEVEGTGAAPPQGRGYIYGGYRDVPFQCWDNTKNRQLEAAFVERCITDAAGTILPPASQPATFDSTWAPDESDLGGREYLFALSYSYADVEKPAIGYDGAVVDNTQPLMYALAVHLRAATDVIDPADIFEFVFANPATDNDVYVFETDALVRGNQALAKTGLSAVRAVPNPYYAHSTYELDQFNRRIRFMNLPETCKIRIYNLAGQLVRTLDKTDATTSVVTWDLHTEQDLPVGSGVYIFQVDAPGVGRHTSRVVVFMEKERLNSF